MWVRNLRINDPFHYLYLAARSLGVVEKHLVYPKRSPSANAVVISSARTLLLDEVRDSVPVAIVWTKAHTKIPFKVARGNKLSLIHI